MKLSKQRTSLYILVAAIAGLMIWTALQRPDIVLYCAHDSVYANDVIRRFEATSGLRVAVKYDTEATKSLGLTELLIREQAHPRCDLFWNNELLGTLDLDARGILDSYKGSGYARIPESRRDPDGAWAGFGARMRVFIVNTNLCPADPSVIAERLAGDDLSRVAMAKPLYGTTLTQYCILWRDLGEDGLKALHRSMRNRGLRELPGNSSVKNQVAAGGCDFGYTDTDDLFLALDAQAPVAWLPVETEKGQTIVIPNTVALIKGAPHRKAATRLIDYLLSEETELALANSASRQIPLGPVDPSKLSDDVRGLLDAASRGCSLEGLVPAREACVNWLKQE